MKDFSNFEHGDSVYELGGGVVPEIAEVFEHNLPDNPDSQNLYQLFKLVGEKPTLQDNIKGAEAYLVQVTGSKEAAVDLASSWVQRSGVQEPLNRSLWSPSQQANAIGGIVVTGAVANWQDRGANLVLAQTGELNRVPIYMPLGNRLMNGPTEVTNYFVQAWQEDNDGQLPTEQQYGRDIIQPVFEAAGFSVTTLPYETKVGDVIAENFFKDLPHLAQEKLLFARVANAGIQFAVQYRQPARAINPGFDADPSNPQAFVLTDSLPVATNLEQATKPEEFQNPYSGSRQLLATAQSIAKAQEQDA